MGVLHEACVPILIYTVLPAHVYFEDIADTKLQIYVAWPYLNDWNRNINRHKPGMCTNYIIIAKSMETRIASHRM